MNDALALRHAFATSDLRRAGITGALLLGLVLALSMVIRLTGSTDLGAPYSIASVGLLAGLTLLAARGAESSGVTKKSTYTSQLQPA